MHKSAVATRCASEQKENIEINRLLLTDSQSPVCLGYENERAEVGAELIPVSTPVLPERNLVESIHNNSSSKKSCRDFEKTTRLLEVSKSSSLYPQQFFQKEIL